VLEQKNKDEAADERAESGGPSREAYSDAIARKECHLDLSRLSFATLKQMSKMLPPQLKDMFDRYDGESKKCCTLCCMQIIPPHVLLEWRKLYTCMDPRGAERNAHIFLHILTMHFIALGKTAKSKIITHDGYKIKVALKGHSKKPTNPNLEHFIFDLKDSTKVYPICQNALRLVTGAFSHHIVSDIRKRIIDENWSLADFKDNLFNNRTRFAPLRETIHQFLEEHIAVSADCDPTTEMKYFSHGEISILHSLYVDEWYKGNFSDFGVDIESNKPPAKVRYFAQVLKSDFGRFVRLPKRMHKFKKCSYCADLRTSLATRSSHALTRKMLRVRLTRHWQWVNQCRRKYRWHKAKARMFSEA
jgi:hypothetical protein